MRRRSLFLFFSSRPLSPFETHTQPELLPTLNNNNTNGPSTPPSPPSPRQEEAEKGWRRRRSTFSRADIISRRSCNCRALLIIRAGRAVGQGAECGAYSATCRTPRAREFRGSLAADAIADSAADAHTLPPTPKPKKQVARWMNSTPAELLADTRQNKTNDDDDDPFFGAHGRLAPRAGLGAAPAPPPSKAPPTLAVAGTTLERNLGAQLGFGSGGGHKHKHHRRREATPSDSSSSSSSDDEGGRAAAVAATAAAAPTGTATTATNARAALLQVDPAFLSKWQRKRQRQKEKKKKSSEGN
jgi:hypothetical protein